MTIDRVITSYKMSLAEVGIILALVVTDILPPGLGLIFAGFSAGLAYGREMAWRQNSG